MKKLIEFDPATHTKTYHDYDHETRQTYVITEQDAQPYLEANKEAYKDESARSQGIKDGWWKVASIPNGLIEKWLAEEGLDVFNRDHWPKVMQKLNDPDWRYLRTSRGRI